MSTPETEAASRDPGFYWILIADEPKPALRDGSGWAFIGGGELTEEPRVLRRDPIVYSDAPAD